MNIEAFFRLSYGLYIVSSVNKEGRFNGHVNNTSFQITSDPPQFAVSVNKDNLTADYIKESGVFCISILDDGIDKDYIQPFGFKSGRDIDKFEGVDYKVGKSGAPILLKHTASYIDCEVVTSVEIDTHIVFIGKAVDAQVINPDGVPITYERYRNEIKGRAPKNAPTFYNKKLKEKFAQQAEEEKPKAGGQKWECMTCGHIYDPAVGDPESGIPPGTTFEDLPDDWECPDCGVSKAEFQPLDD